MFRLGIHKKHLHLRHPGRLFSHPNNGIQSYFKSSAGVWMSRDTLNSKPVFWGSCWGGRILLLFTTSVWSWNTSSQQCKIPIQVNRSWCRGIRKVQRLCQTPQTQEVSCCQWLFLVPLKGGRWHIIPQLAVYTTYTLPSGGLYATYHLLGEPETTIDPKIVSNASNARGFMLLHSHNFTLPETNIMT